MLKNIEANVNTQGGYYCNVLQAVSLENHEKMIQILINTGVDVNTQNKRYNNALFSKNYIIISAEFLIN